MMTAQSYRGNFGHNPLERDTHRVLQYTPTADGYIMSENGKNLYPPDFLLTRFLVANAAGGATPRPCIIFSAPNFSF